MLDQPAIGFGEMSEYELRQALAYYRDMSERDYRYEIECCIESLGYDPDNERVREYRVTINGWSGKRYIYAETPGKAKYIAWCGLHDVVPIPFTNYRAKLAKARRGNDSDR